MRYLFLFFCSLVFAQQNIHVDFISAKANLIISDGNKTISGRVLYDFKVLANTDSIRIDAKNMNFELVFINDKNVAFKNSSKQLILFEGYKNGLNTLVINYNTKPKQTLYFVGSKAEDNLQIWTQGQGKYTSFWLPSFDDVNEKMIFETTITFDSDYKVISNGILVESTKNSRGTTTWHYKMVKPMASYLAMLAIGKWNCRSEKSKSGIILENYLQAKDQSKHETTYAFSKQIFDYLETEIGIKYPWKIYRNIPIDDFLYAGMENTTSTLFSQDFVVDSVGYNDKNYINVNAHELAHQWFGNLVTAKSGKHHWLQEGFATYFALLAERKLFGDDYFFYQMQKNAQLVSRESKSDTIPILSEKASSTSFYQKGSLALFALHEKIGDKKFKAIIKNYLTKYQFKNVETQNFLNEIKKISTFDILTFQKKWLESAEFQSEEIDSLLTKNGFIAKLKEIQNRKKLSFVENEIYFSGTLKSNSFYPLKVEIINQLKNVPFELKSNLLRLAMKSSDIGVRQAIAITMDEIPLEFKTEYESFLDDKSYQTQEIALMRLYNQFPESQNKYLKISKNWTGTNDHNLRIIYLFLTQLNRDFDVSEKQKNLLELIDYTSSKYDSSIRKNAFDAAFQLKPIDDDVLENLVQATTHFRWQFSKYAKDYLRSLLKIESFRTRFESSKTDFSNENKIQLQRFLDEKQAIKN